MSRIGEILRLALLASIGCLLIVCQKIAVGIAADSSPAAQDNSAASPIGLKLFDGDVHAVFASKCVKCHGGQKTESGFNLTTREGLLKGGESGEAVVPGKSADSPMLKLLRHEDEPHMPKDAPKLSDEVIAKISAWIDAGAPYSKPLSAEASPQGHANVTAADRQFWSFLPLSNPEPPAVKDEGWCRTPIDRFILAKLVEKGVAPNGVAYRRQLIRRASFDLTGLPPTEDEVVKFEHDPAPDAYEKLIDRLLASPHYGERWARHWLDVARFAESHGYEQDYDRPYAYHYRDFVIKALNADMPFDQFARWQIAGDEFEPDNPDAWMATGFLAAGTHATQITANQAEKERYDELDDQAATVGTAFLGLTIGCARCHDHKYDPIPTRDYYRIISTFTKTVRSDYPVVIDAADYRSRLKEYEDRHNPLVRELDDYEKNTIEQRRSQWHEQPLMSRWWKWIERSPFGLDAAIATEIALRAGDANYRGLWWQSAQDFLTAPHPKTVTALVSSEGIPAVRLHTQGPDFYEQTYFLKRGDLNQKLEPAEPGFLQVLTRSSDESQWRQHPGCECTTPFNRGALANWLTDADCGAGQLVARVIVNRLWQHHFGRGIVATPSDFGAQGQRPTHPELLEWLAGELVRNGWHLKPLQRVIMTSAVYMESPDYDADRAKLDPDNLLCWRRTRQRLEAEAIRDEMLAVSGLLDTKMHGKGTLDESQTRRSIYFTLKRSKMIPMLMLFDEPDSLQGIGQRPSTTVAPQALWMLNNPQVRRYATALTQRILSATDSSPTSEVRMAYQIALSRNPTNEERDDTVAFLKSQQESYRAAGKGTNESEAAALADMCQAIFSLNEFMFVE
jgi:cytochrome c553